MTRLPAVDPDTATGETKVLLDAVHKKLGLTPNVIRTLANSPAALKAYLGIGDALATGRFSAKEREAIALTTAGANTCEYCASAHSAISKNLKIDSAEIDLRLDGHSRDPQLDAVLVFARQVTDQRGFVSNDDIASVRDAGYDDSAIAEIVANVVANILTNYINHVAETEIDFPKVDLVTSQAA